VPEAPRAGWRALIVVTIAALGFSMTQAITRLAPEADTSRWTLGESSVPIEVAALAGDLRPRADALDLWSYRVASPRIPAFTEGTVELDAIVPDGGQLSVRFGADTVAGPLRPVLLDGPGRPGQPGPPNGQPGPPNGQSGPPNGQSGPPPNARPNNPAQPGRGAGVVIDRGARSQIVGRGLTCTAAATPTSPTFRLGLTARGGTIEVSVDGKPASRCTGTWSPGALVLASGVRRVQVERFGVTPVGGATFDDSFGSPLLAPIVSVLTAVAFAACSWFATRRSAPRAVAVALAPLLALPILGAIPLRGALDALRMLEVPEALGPFVFAGIPAAIAATLVAGALAPTLRQAALHGLAPLGGLVGVLTTQVFDLPADTLGWVILALVGVPMSVLAYVNTHPFERRVAASYALTLLIALGAELGLRNTALNDTWTATAGWKRASEEFSQLLEIRQYRAYPDEGFPVRPPQPDPSRRRIVALGGSSTGGAYQMDDIEQFWPRRLQDRLHAGWQVVNQGVGGWNTLHVRLYLESQIERLDGDIYVLYVGHNDVLSPAPVPYRQMYASWSAPGGALRATSAALNQVRLYVGLKYTLFGLMSSRTAVAVPVPDARENLAAIIAIAKAHGAHVLLVTEGLNPDPYPMAPYNDMLAALATETGSAHFDAATALAKEDPELFLDDCHLSVEGHTVLAGWIDSKLRAAGWL
jgi:lysophospholipase L1-like esterase